MYAFALAADVLFVVIASLFASKFLDEIRAHTSILLKIIIAAGVISLWIFCDMFHDYVGSK